MITIIGLFLFLLIVALSHWLIIDAIWRSCEIDPQDSPEVKSSLPAPPGLMDAVWQALLILLRLSPSSRPSDRG